MSGVSYFTALKYANGGSFEKLMTSPFLVTRLSVGFVEYGMLGDYVHHYLDCQMWLDKAHTSSHGLCYGHAWLNSICD